MQTAGMAKNLMFKLRLGEQDRERLDFLAEHYSAPASTVLRILIKREFDSMGGAAPVAPLRPGRALEASPVAERPKHRRRPTIAVSDTLARPSPHALAEPSKKRGPKERKRR